jgi:oxygen-dependent protoporphyrinogen oxidase
MSLFVGGMRNQKMAMLPDSEIHNIVEEELKHLFGLKEFKPRIFKVYRHPYAIPQYGVQSAERLAKIDEIENTHKGLYLAGNIRNGIGMADRIKQAKDLAYII